MKFTVVLPNLKSIVDEIEDTLGRGPLGAQFIIEAALNHYREVAKEFRRIQDCGDVIWPEPTPDPDEDEGGN